MKQSHWLLCVAKNCDWSRKITPLSRLNRAVAYRGMKLKTYSESRIELWNLQILKKMLEKSSQIFVIRAALWAEKLGRCLEYCRSWKNTLGKLAVAVNTGGHSIRVIQELWMKMSVSDGGNLCPLSCGWKFSNQFDISVGDTLYSCYTVVIQLRYSWPWAVASYTLFAAVPWNGLEWFAADSNVMCLFQLILKIDVLMFYSWRQSVSTLNSFETENFLNKSMP